MNSKTLTDATRFHRFILLRSPFGYSASFFRWGFASARLQLSLREMHVQVAKRSTNAGWDRNASLSPMVAEYPRFNRSGELFHDGAWSIDDDVAIPKHGSLNGTQGKTSVHHFQQGWLVVISDPDADEHRLHKLAEEWNTLALVIENATDRVRAGELRTLPSVNDFLSTDAHRLGNLRSSSATLPPATRK